MLEKQPTVFNATGPMDNVTDGSKASEEDVAPPHSTEEDTITEQPEVEEDITESIEDNDNEQHYDHV